jgi:hypothetical protein
MIKPIFSIIKSEIYFQFLLLKKMNPAYTVRLRTNLDRTGTEQAQNRNRTGTEQAQNRKRT